MKTVVTFKNVCECALHISVHIKLSRHVVITRMVCCPDELTFI